MAFDMNRVTLPEYLKQLAQKLCANEKTDLKTHCEISTTDLAAIIPITNQPFTAFYEPLCLENLSTTGLFVLLLPYSKFLQKQLKQHRPKDSHLLPSELSVIEKKTNEYSKQKTAISKEMLIKLYDNFCMFLSKQQLESLAFNTNGAQMLRINTCLNQGLQLLDKLSPLTTLSQFVLEHMSDLYINLILLNEPSQKDPLSKQILKKYRELATYSTRRPSFHHCIYRDNAPLTQQLRLMRLSHAAKNVTTDAIELNIGCKP